MTQVMRNPRADPRSWPEAPDAVARFHERMEGYETTPLYEAPAIASRLGLARVLIKAETHRLGLPSFKIIGASWAVYRTLCEHAGNEPEPWTTVDDLADRWAHLAPLTLVAATDGNYGRAVAHMARLLGLDSLIFVPTGTSPARIDAIESEGAAVRIVDGDYDDAVVQSSEQADESHVVVSDISWPGHEAPPLHVIDGYSTIFAEIEATTLESDLDPGLVVIPMGVGAFMAAAVTHYRSSGRRTLIAGVEPLTANCVQRSALAGDLVQVPGPHESIMAGLNCGRPSAVAWQRLKSGVDWLVSIPDDATESAMSELADVGVVAGETGASSLAGLHALVEQMSETNSENLAGTTALVVVTEGATDPASYRRIVGRPPEEIAPILPDISKLHSSTVHPWADVRITGNYQRERRLGRTWVRRTCRRHGQVPTGGLFPRCHPGPTGSRQVVPRPRRRRSLGAGRRPHDRCRG